MLSTLPRFLVASRGGRSDGDVICCQPFGVGGALYQIQIQQTLRSVGVDLLCSKALSRTGFADLVARLAFVSPFGHRHVSDCVELSINV